MNKKKKQKVLLHLASKFGWLIILLLGKLSFIKIIGRKHFEDLINHNKRFIFVLWHGRILIPIYIHRGKGITAMASIHADGEMIAQTLHKLGYQTVRGSSTHRGKQAFHDMVEVLSRGGVGAMIPDGPQGPRHHLKPGTLYLAQQTGAYLLPITFSAKRRIIFNSWDRFNLLIPFSKSIVIYGKPVKVAKGISSDQFEKLRLQLEKQMIHLEQKADEYFRK